MKETKTKRNSETSNSRHNVDFICENLLDSPNHSQVTVKVQHSLYRPIQAQKVLGI